MAGQNNKDNDEENKNQEKNNENNVIREKENNTIIREKPNNTKIVEKKQILENENTDSFNENLDNEQGSSFGSNENKNDFKTPMLRPSDENKETEPQEPRNKNLEENVSNSQQGKTSNNVNEQENDFSQIPTKVYNMPDYDGNTRREEPNTIQNNMDSGFVMRPPTIRPEQEILQRNEFPKSIEKPIINDENISSSSLENEMVMGTKSLNEYLKEQKEDKIKYKGRKI